MLNLPKAFTQSASTALIQAQISAAAMGFDRVGSGHLLIGLCRSGDELTRSLLDRVTVKEIESEVESITGRGEAGFPRVSAMTPHMHRILARAITYASPEKKTLAGTAHLWLELLNEEGCTALKALESLGRNAEALTAALFDAAGPIERTEIAQKIPASDQPLAAVVVHVRQDPGRRQERADAKPSPEDKAENETALERYSRDLTAAAREGKLEPLIGRESEVASMVRILGKKTKNNPMLIGEPGVGKSALVEGLAQRISGGKVPEMLRNTKILALDLAQMVAGSKYRGEFEDRIKHVLECAQDEGDVILFIDEMHTLIGAGGSEGSLDAANMLKPALARGQIRVIGATTHKEYRKYVEKDPALARRFQRIDVREPDDMQTLEILEGLRERYENYHQVSITDGALRAAVSLSARYVTDRFMPDKAIDLIDEASSMAKLEDEGEKAGDVAEAHAAENDADRVTISEAEVARIVAEWTGIPFEHVHTAQANFGLDLEKQLNKRVIGQEEAVSVISKAIRRAHAGLSDPDKPLGVFMLLGPSGVGKTELCKALSTALFSREDALIRIDMSEYSEEATVSRLIGSPPGYIGHGEGGQLTDAVLKQPYSVVLFDEVEKAHPKVFSLLLQLLDDGLLTDSVGRKVNFRNTIVVMTSNAGIAYDMNKHLGFSAQQSGQHDEKRKKAILEKVRQTFRPEFLGRIDEMIVMRSLDAQAGKRIAALMLDAVASRIGKRGIRVSYTDAALARLSELGVDPMSGARGLRRVVQEKVENPLSELILTGEAGREIMIDCADGEIRMSMLEKSLN